MISFPTQYLVVCGPDLAGKTSLIRGIHKESGYRWNIQDRSFLSMLIYAKMYGRDTGLHAKGLWSELTNLNNRIVFLLPPEEAVLRRFAQRGDDIQDEDGVRRVHAMFEDHDWLGSFPNVLLMDNGKDGEAALERAVTHACAWAHAKESADLEDVANEVRRFVSVMPTGAPDNMRGYETQLSFTLYDDLGFEESDSEIMADEEEGEYYQGILHRVMGKLGSELAGHNEYSEKQDASSRRFVYTDDTCISFIQFLIRDGLLDMHVILRSTNVLKTFHKDLAFLYYLLSSVHENYSELGPTRAARMRIQLNSAHLVR